MLSVPLIKLSLSGYFSPMTLSELYIFRRLLPLPQRLTPGMSPWCNLCGTARRLFSVSWGLNTGAPLSHFELPDIVFRRSVTSYKIPRFRPLLCLMGCSRHNCHNSVCSVGKECRPLKMSEHYIIAGAQTCIQLKGTWRCSVNLITCVFFSNGFWPTTPPSVPFLLDCFILPGLRKTPGIVLCHQESEACRRHKTMPCGLTSPFPLPLSQ